MPYCFSLKPGSHDEISISTSSGTFDVHKRKHKKNATFVLLMFTSKVPLAYAYAYAYFIV
jgi:hypothetical protein